MAAVGVGGKHGEEFAEEWSGLLGCERVLRVPWEGEGTSGTGWPPAADIQARGDGGGDKRGQRRGASDALGLGREGRGRSPSPLVHLSHPQVTLIPTFDSVVMHEWYEETHARHQALGITVLGSNSTVSMQDEAFPACKVEF